MLEWIWVSAAVPVGIAVVTSGLAWLETRLLAEIPSAVADPVSDAAHVVPPVIAHAAAHL